MDGIVVTVNAVERAFCSAIARRRVMAVVGE